MSTILNRKKGALSTPVEYRYEVTLGGKVRRRSREDASILYGCPIRAEAADAYIWEESPDRYVVAVKAETRPRNQRPRQALGCYHITPTKDAAVMLALALAGGG